MWFVADPDRTDLALFDPRARDLARAYRWGFVEPPFVGGARPDNVDWYRMQPPNWMLDRGWSLTAEIGGVTAQRQAGPAGRARDRLAPASAAARRPSCWAAGISAAGVSPVTVTLHGSPVETFPAPNGYFVHLLDAAGGRARRRARLTCRSK